MEVVLKASSHLQNLIEKTYFMPFALTMTGSLMLTYFPYSQSHSFSSFPGICAKYYVRYQSTTQIFSRIWTEISKLFSSLQACSSSNVSCHKCRVIDELFQISLHMKQQKQSGKYLSSIPFSGFADNPGFPLGAWNNFMSQQEPLQSLHLHQIG